MAGVHGAVPRGLHRAWAGWVGRSVEVAEVALLVTLFALVPAYLAIGTYFICWHSLRHRARLLLLRDEDARTIAAGNVLGPVARLARDLVPVTVLALVAWMDVAQLRVGAHAGWSTA